MAEEKIAVQQIQIHAATSMRTLSSDLRARQLHADQHLAAIGTHHRRHWQRIEVVQRRLLLLPSVRIERLLQVAF